MERTDFHKLVADLEEHLIASAVEYLDREGLSLDREKLTREGSTDWSYGAKEMLFHGCDCFPTG